MTTPILFKFTCAVALLIAPLASAQHSNTSFDVIATFQYPSPKALFTNLYGISNSGVSVGFFSVQKSDGYYGASFVRTSAGAFSGPLEYPGAISTTGFGVNISGVVCGCADLSPGGFVGFFYDGTSYTEYQAPGSAFTEVLCINDNGDFGGVFMTDQFYGFVNVGGVLTSFVVPGAQVTQINGINNLGQAVGSYFDSDDIKHGFFRDTDGTLIYPIDFPGAYSTSLNGINDRGLIVGDWAVQQYGYVQALTLELPHRFTSYEYTANGPTEFNGVNNRGLISGLYGGGGLIVQLIR